MAIVSLEQLQTPMTEEQALDQLLNILSGFGFQTTSWQSGSVQYTLVRMSAFIWSQVTILIASLSKGAFNQTSTGDTLTAFSLSQYDNVRQEAVTTKGDLMVTLDTSITTPPLNFGIGDLIVAEDLDLSGSTTNKIHIYRNTTAFTINNNTPQFIEFEAEASGADYNDPGIDSINVLITPVPGLTATNAVPDPELNPTWITTQGTDEEADEKLRERNTSRWAALPFTGPRSAYEYWALTAHPTIEKVLVDDSLPRGAGTVDIYIASNSGPILFGSDGYIAATNILDLHRPITTSALVKEVTVRDLQLTGIIYLLSQYNNNATKATIKQSIKDFLVPFPIGGDLKVATAVNYKVTISQVIEAIMVIPGVISTSISFAGATPNYIILAKGDLVLLDETYYNAHITYQ